MARHGVAQQLVQLGGGHAPPQVFAHARCCFQHLAHALPGLGRNEQHRRIGNKFERLADLFLKNGERVVLFFDQVPLVDDDDRALAGFYDVGADVRILRGDPIVRVDQQQCDVAALDGPQRAEHAVLLHLAVGDVPAPTDARRVHQRDLLAVPCDVRIHHVTRGAGNLADNGALLSRQGVQE